MLNDIDSALRHFMAAYWMETADYVYPSFEDAASAFAYSESISTVKSLISELSDESIAHWMVDDHVFPNKKQMAFWRGLGARWITKSQAHVLIGFLRARVANVSAHSSGNYTDRFR